MVTEQFKCFNDELCKCDSKRTASSVTTYCYNLCWLQKRLDGFDDGGFPSFEAVMDYMTENKIPARRQQSTFVAMKVLLNARGKTSESEKYAQPLIDVRNQLQNAREKQEMSETKAKNWVEFKDLKAIAKQTRTDTFNLDKRVLWSKDEYARAQIAFILTFHFKFPLRRVLCTVKYKPADPTSGNVLDDKTKTIIIRDHKMKRKYPEPFTFQLDRNMWRLAQLLRAHHTMRGVKEDMNLILSRYWRPMSRNSFCTWLKREMRAFECCKGKNVGCLMIRNVVISHRRRSEMKLAQKEQFAKDCMHSTKQNELYRCD